MRIVGLANATASDAVAFQKNIGRQPVPLVLPSLPLPLLSAMPRLDYHDHHVGLASLPVQDWLLALVVVVAPLLALAPLAVVVLARQQQNISSNMEPSWVDLQVLAKALVQAVGRRGLVRAV